MFNAIIIVGEKRTNTYKTENDDIHYARLLVDVKRNYLSNTGEAIIDTIIVKVYRGMADMIDEAFPIGSLLGIKGRIEESDNNLCIVVAEKIELFKNDEL